MAVVPVTQPHKYLIETNPALTDLKQFMGSDYLLANLGYQRKGDRFIFRPVCERCFRSLHASSLT